ncbi:MAG: glycosyltransferase family 2 protein [Alphaproteobacteria bacterium]
MLVSVLIINYNSGERLKRCLSCLAEQSFRGFEAIIIDNASTDSSANIPMPDERFRLIKSDTNLGFAAGNNRAAADAKGEWLVLLNPDAYAQSDWLEKLLDAAKRYPNCTLFGSTQINDQKRDRLDGCGDCYNFAGFPWRGGIGWPVTSLPAEGEVFAPCGAASMYRADIFKNIGGFDERFFCYCEDVDIAWRFRLDGHHCMQIASAVVYHEGSAITGVASPFSVFHGTRNRIWTYVMNMPGPLFWPSIPLHILGNLLLMTNPSTIPSRIKGIIAAFKGMGPIWKTRVARQRSRRAPILQIAKALTWSLGKMFTRQEDVRPN